MGGGGEKIHFVMSNAYDLLSFHPVLVQFVFSSQSSAITNFIASIHICIFYFHLYWSVLYVFSLFDLLNFSIYYH